MFKVIINGKKRMEYHYIKFWTFENTNINVFTKNCRLNAKRFNQSKSEKNKNTHKIGDAKNLVKR